MTQGETSVNLRQKIVEAGWARVTVKEWKPKEGKEPPKPRQSDEVCFVSFPRLWSL